MKVVILNRLFIFSILGMLNEQKLLDITQPEPTGSFSSD